MFRSPGTSGRQVCEPFAFIVASGIGLVLTFIGLYRAGTVPRWVLGTIVDAGLQRPDDVSPA